MLSNSQKQFSAFALAVALVSVVSAPARAVTPEELGLSAELTQQLEASFYSPSAAPAVSFGSPVGFGAGYGEFFAGIGGETLPDGGPDPVDGSIGLGVGIGDPTDWVALEVSTSIISMTEDFGHDGSVSYKLHHAFGNKIGVAVGVYNTGRWGDAKQGFSSTYAAITRPFQVSPMTTLTLNAGIGDGRFGQWDNDVDRYDGIGGFGSAALTFARRFSVIADYTGHDINAGISMLPFYNWPLVITAGVLNLTEDRNHEKEFAGGFAYTFRF